MNNQLNQFLQNIMVAQRQGKNPQVIMQQMIQQNPQTRQMITQMRNMAGNRSPQEFIMQLAKQNGADDNALQMISQILNHR